MWPCHAHGNHHTALFHPPRCDVAYTAARHTACDAPHQVDPVIRASMDINLAESVIIFDEGHNIEDTARWGASRVRVPCSVV
jgi:Rad3-related DNA helicase